MRARPVLSLLVASSFVLATAAPRAALAQPPRKPVEPVPYAASQPVPYSAGAPLPPPQVNVPVVTSQVGPDIVELKGGGMIRGTLLEEVPNDHATVQLATGQVAIIPWERVERVERGAGNRTATAPAATPAARAGVMVHIDTDSEEPVTLEAHIEGSREWRVACTSPCDHEVDADAEYRVTGPGMRNSAAFHLGARSGERLVLTVSPSSKSGFVWGIVLTATGPITMIAGALVLLVASAEDGFGNSSTDTSSAKSTGTVLVLGGLAMTIGGVVMIVGNARSRVTQETPSTRRDRDEAWLRLPTWHDDPTAAALPKQVTVPFFHTTF